MDSVILQMETPEDTRRFANWLGERMVEDVFIALSGDLGVGKTAFVQGLAEGMGVDDVVTSPTFTIMNYYEGKLPLKHFDFYRLNEEEELYHIGWDEYSVGGVTVVEWADIFPRLLPLERICIFIEKIGENQRKFTISWSEKAPEVITKEIRDYASGH